jgi:uncharacterized repeat protein (TIGR01451 family)
VRILARVSGILILCFFITQLLYAEPFAGPGVSRHAWSSEGIDGTQHPDFFLSQLVELASSANGLRNHVYDTLAKLSPALQATLFGGEETTFLVMLDEQVDLNQVPRLGSKEARGQAVYEALRTLARRAQAPLRAELDARGVEYRAFYIVNMLAVRANAALALALAARPEVARLEANPTVRANLPVAELNQELAPSATNSALQIDSPEWGVERIRAHDVWALGYTGQGIVVAGQDTGYEWDHPALKAQYRGWNDITVTHDYNWHDAIHADDPNTSAGNPCGFSSPEPCDDNSHGTHTMGTIVGDDRSGNQVGVAPEARWIGCRNMEQGWGTPSSYAECFEFFLAPYPVGGDPMTDGDPSMAPHVINNSWSCPPSEGCDADSLRTVVENVRAAGIVVVTSAGNEGPDCGTVSSPPALHAASFAVGATDNSDWIAGFSSRGPVSVDGGNRGKPDVSAPGVGVRSSLPGGGYGYKSGTSMAAPHVTGLLALLWSAAPQLIGRVDLTEEVIQEAARPVVSTSCGGDVDGHPNNVYGWGIVDALAAVKGVSGGLAVSANAHPTWVAAGGAVTYTFTVSNTSLLSQTADVVLRDTLPVGTTFTSARGNYTLNGGEVAWDLGTVGPGGQASVTLAVRVGITVPAGASIVNADYSVRSSQVPTPVFGAAVVTLVPWQVFLPITAVQGP